MALSLGPGSRLGSFGILSLLGGGGMGEVYRARDTVLKREVALKVLPAAFAEDGERLARFTREAEVLASLNHPHIAQIYGVAEGDGVRAIVMELVEGETLAARLARGAIPLADALPIARQIAEALEAAHEHGVVHRDLKPANIVIRDDGTVKVLDFGLAKATERGSAADGRPTDLSNSPTMTSPAALSGHGVILGTAAYMSPEQARGKPVDRRADIWAFGCVLFELLTGRPAFAGETVTDVLAAIVDKTPAWNALPATTPASVTQLLRRCLAKDLPLRLPHIGAARLDLSDAIGGRLQPDSETDTGPWGARATSSWPPSLSVGAVVFALVLAAFAGWAVPRPAPTRSQRVVRFDLDVPVDRLSALAIGARPLAVSPDGSRIVYYAGKQLYLHALEGTGATPLPGTEGASTRQHPFFSPDGQWVAFHRTGRLLKVAVSGGAPVPVCPVDAWGGGSWGADDRIVFAQVDGIYQVPSAGGAPERLIALDLAKGEQARHPQVLPDGTTVLYSLTAGRTNWSAGRIVAQTPGQSERRLVLDGGFDARYVRTGHLVYSRNAAVYVIPFDARRSEVTGDAVRVADGVQSGQNIPAVPTQVLFNMGAAAFAVAGTVLVYAPAPQASSLVWVDRHGKVEPIGEPMDTIYHTVRLAPDGRRAVADVVSAQGGGVWVHDLTRGTRTLLLRSSTIASLPDWTPDGARVTLTAPEQGGTAIVERLADGTGDARPVFSAPGAYLEPSWSPGGRVLVVTSNGTATGADVSVVTPGGRPEAFVATPADERVARFSPDGRWIAYQSDTSGRPEIYVQPYPGPGPRVLVSTGGGLGPQWARDGSELFYHDGTALMTVPIRTVPTFAVGTPTRLFDAGFLVADDAGHGAYDVAPDGKRFLMIRPVPASRINVVLNWAEALRDRR